MSRKKIKDKQWKENKSKKVNMIRRKKYTPCGDIVMQIF